MADIKIEECPFDEEGRRAWWLRRVAEQKASGLGEKEYIKKYLWNHTTMAYGLFPIWRQRYEAMQRSEKEGAEKDQRRREQARLTCELEYSRFCPEIQQRMSRAELNAYLERYMNDKVPADEVERRSMQLLALIQRDEQSMDSIEDLAHWYIQQKAKINSLSLDDKLKNYHLAELNERYSQLSEELMRKAKP
jgi:hypothetical protein